MDYETIVKNIFDYFEGEYFHIGLTVGINEVKGQYQQDNLQYFDHIYVDQGGGGITGDVFHGTIYFYIGNGRYATAEY